MFFAPASKAVLGRRQKRLGSLILLETPIAVSDEMALPAMLKGIRDMGFRCFPLSKELEAWRQRACWLRRCVSDCPVSALEPNASASVAGLVLQLLSQR